ncbi:hypothetical protein MMC25_005099 [Agyrium rufum]|nr:hypothetical protein [Agyrium rufum]
MSTAAAVIDTPSVSFDSALDVSKKRKRSEDEGSLPNGDSETSSTSDLLQAILLDLYEVLKGEDIFPSILEAKIPIPSKEDNATKKARLSEDASTTTSIKEKVYSASYQSIGELLKDVDTAAASFTSREAEPIPILSDHSSSCNLHEARATALKGRINGLLRREVTRRPLKMPITQMTDIENMNTQHEDDKKINIVATTVSGSGKAVLTLYGSAPYPRQLFSSLQKGDSVLRENALPNGISTTRVVPAHRRNLETPKLGELFPAPTALTALNPPRPSRHTATRSQTVNFYKPTESTSRPRVRETYTTAPTSTGKWLHYSNPSATTTQEPKKQSRTRGLSINGAKPPPPIDPEESSSETQLDTLFKNAYSSFAPIRDDSLAIVSEQIKNKIWWNRIGQHRFHSYMSSLQPSDEANDEDESFGEEADPIAEEEFKAAVDAWEPEEFGAKIGKSNEMKASREVSEADVDDLLKEVAELLETLMSHQKARTLSLNLGRSNATTSETIDPSLKPSSAEFDIYDLLKTQLSLMISSLPPYAVAKLNGEQLEALSIRAVIPIEAQNGRGTMAGTESSTPRPGLVATPTRPITSTARSNHVAPAQYAPAATHRNSYASTSTPRAVTTSTQFTTHRYGGTPGAHQYTGGYGAATQPPQRRPFNVATTSTHHNTPSHPNQYTNGTRPTYANQYPASAPRPQTNSASWSQRPTSSHLTNGVSSGAPSSYQPLTYPNRVNNASHQSPRPAAQYYPPSSVGPINAAAIQNNSAVPGTVGQHLNLSPEEQAMLMSRQKAQIAQQMQMNIRQGSGTPQPNVNTNPSTEGGTGAASVRVDGTGSHTGTPTPASMPVLNGVSAGNDGQ